MSDEQPTAKVTDTEPRVEPAPSVESVPSAEPAPVGGGASATVLTPMAMWYLDQTRPWVRFMSVTAFVMAGLMVVIGIVMFAASLFGGVIAKNAGEPAALRNAVGGALLAFFYIAMTAVYVVPGIYLSRYASAIRSLTAQASAGRLEDALKHQKSFWRFIGIFSAVSMIVMVVVLGLALVVGVFAAIAAPRA